MGRHRILSRTPCAPGRIAVDLIRFCDGELTWYRARRFRQHLVHCEHCRRDVVGVMQLIAQLSDTA